MYFSSLHVYEIHKIIVDFSAVIIAYKMILPIITDSMKFVEYLPFKNHRMEF